MPPSTPDEAPHLPALTSAPLTTEKTWVLGHATDPQPDHNPIEVKQLAFLVDAGFGNVSVGVGDPVVVRMLDGGTPPAPGASPKLLTRFVHLADTQLADDESPGRLMVFDAMGETQAAFRPHEAWNCAMLNSAVRTINALHAKTPVDFVLTGGDNADNAQKNEQQWFRQILDGAPKVECDSGDDDDPVPGPGNDPKDPIFAEGLKMPWKWITGNHDIENQGNFPVTDDVKKGCLGDNADFGARDWSKPSAVIVQNMKVVADSRREPMTRANLLAELAITGDGHGVKDPAARVDGKAFYSFDVPGGAVRIIVLDTAAETGGSEGLMRRSDLQSRVRPMLEKAEADGKWVILSSHHAARSLGDGTGLGGSLQPDVLTTAEWREFVGGFPHVVLQLAGHSHHYQSGIASPASGHAYWEAESASLADWPSQLRLVEVWDEDNGYLAIKLLPLDFSEENDALARQYRRYAALDLTSGWQSSPGPDRGVMELWFPR